MDDSCLMKTVLWAAVSVTELLSINHKRLTYTTAFHCVKMAELCDGSLGYFTLRILQRRFNILIVVIMTEPHQKWGDADNRQK